MAQCPCSPLPPWHPKGFPVTVPRGQCVFPAVTPSWSKVLHHNPPPPHRALLGIPPCPGNRTTLSLAWELVAHVPSGWPLAGGLTWAVAARLQPSPLHKMLRGCGAAVHAELRHHARLPLLPPPWVASTAAPCLPWPCLPPHHSCWESNSSLGPVPGWRLPAPAMLCHAVMCYPQGAV